MKRECIVLLRVSCRCTGCGRLLDGGVHTPAAGSGAEQETGLVPAMPRRTRGRRERLDLTTSGVRAAGQMDAAFGDGPASPVNP